MALQGHTVPPGSGAGWSTPWKASISVQYVFFPLILLVAIGLGWSWWSSRSDRDPAASVHSFHKALDAMQPGTRQSEVPGEPAEAR